MADEIYINLGETLRFKPDPVIHVVWSPDDEWKVASVENVPHGQNYLEQTQRMLDQVRPSIDLMRALSHDCRARMGVSQQTGGPVFQERGSYYELTFKQNVLEFLRWLKETPGVYQQYETIERLSGLRKAIEYIVEAWHGDLTYASMIPPELLA